MIIIFIAADVYNNKQEKLVGNRSCEQKGEKVKGRRHQTDRTQSDRSSRVKQGSHESQALLNQSAEHIYEEIPSFCNQKSVLKDRTNTMKMKSSLKQSVRSSFSFKVPMTAIYM